MSDVSQGPGWWLASDGKWYPPQTMAPPPPPPPPPPAPKGWSRGRVGLVIGGILAVLVIGAGVASGDGGGANSAPTSPEMTTTTLTPDARAMAEGNLAACNDGGYSSNGDFGNTCSSKGGVERWLSRYGRCVDGSYIRMSPKASCEDNDGFERLLRAGEVPENGPDDVALCKDGTFSNNSNFRETCTSKGGVDAWLATYGRCNDGATIKMSTTATCKDNEGFDALLPKGYEPKARRGDVARCKDGTFSDNTDFKETCSSHSGVARWLSSYGKCADGKVIKMAKSASCGGQGFKALLSTSYVPPTTTTTTAPPTTVYVPPTTAYVPPTTTYIPPAPVYSPPATTPAVADGGGATALCNDGTYSYAAHHQGACSHHGGVAVFYK